MYLVGTIDFGFGVPIVGIVRCSAIFLALIKYRVVILVEVFARILLRGAVKCEFDASRRVIRFYFVQ